MPEREKGPETASEKTSEKVPGKAGAKIIRLDEVESTNLFAAALPGGDVVVTAKRQTGGRGTKGRRFVSDEGGVYLSRRTCPENFPAENAFLIMAGASVAVCRTLERFGFSPGIKWPNDVYVAGRKICGILIENTFSGKTVSRSIVGIGLNVNNDFPPELSGIAISMKEAAGHPFDRAAVEEALIEESAGLFPMREYLSRLRFLGEEVMLTCGETTVPARLISVNDRGELLAETAEGERRFSAAEFTLRPARKGPGQA